MKQPPILGYIVKESCEDYEQVLGILTSPELPPGGILDWTKGPRAVFLTKQAARAAIERTEHYRLAFGRIVGPGALPERRFCSIVPLRAAPQEGSQP